MNCSKTLFNKHGRVVFYLLTYTYCETSSTARSAWCERVHANLLDLFRTWLKYHVKCPARTESGQVSHHIQTRTIAVMCDSVIRSGP